MTLTGGLPRVAGLFLPTVKLRPAIVSLPVLLGLPVLAGPIQFAQPMLEPSPFLLWDLSTTVRPSFGYRQNPTLAQDAFREASTFVNVGAELLLFRLPTEGNHFHLFFSGDDRRYLDSSQIEKEQTFVTQAEFRHEFGTGWSTALTGLHVYNDQVVDLSTVDQGRGTTRAAGHTLSARPNVRWDATPQLWFEVESELVRQIFFEPLDDYWEFAPRALAGWKLPRDSSVTASYLHLWRPYDDSPQLSPTGETLPGTLNRIQSDRFELRWKQRWDAGKRWTTTLRGFFHVTQDNGLGFYDYQRPGVALTVQYQISRWTLRAGGRYSRYDYLAQSIAPDEVTTRLREEWGGDLRAQFDVTKNFRLFVDYEFQHSTGNVAVDNYQDHLVQGGFEWEF